MSISVEVTEPTVSSVVEEVVNKWLILAVLCVSLLLALLDGTVVNIALPHIQQAFGVDLSAIQWVIDSYLLAFAVLLITLGRLGDLYGRKRLFMAGVALFTLSSLAAGIAPSIGFLIAARTVQAVGSAAMMPATLSLITATFPVEERGTALGIWGATSGVALVLGPILGGVLVDSFSWRWIFFINLPVGLLGLLAAWRIIPESIDPTASHKIDLGGILLSGISLFCLTFALIEGQNYGWTSPLIMGLFVMTVVGLVAFTVWELRVPAPLMDLSMFRNRTFAAGNVVGAITNFGMMGALFLVPFFLEAVLGYSAVRTGLSMIPMALGVVVVAPAAGHLSDRFGSRFFIAAGLLIGAGGIFWMSRILALNTELWDLVLPFAVTGLGLGMASAPMTTAVMASAPQEKAGSASGVYSTMRRVGAVMGIAVLGATVQNQLATNLENAPTNLIQGIAQTLQTNQQVPDALKPKILELMKQGLAQVDFTNMASRMSPGMGSAGQTLSARTLGLGSNNPYAAQLIELIKPAFNQVLGQAFLDAIVVAFLAGAAICVVGALAALFMQRHVPVGHESEPAGRPTPGE